MPLYRPGTRLSSKHHMHRTTSTAEEPRQLQESSSGIILHRQYLEQLPLPTVEQSIWIAKAQERKEKELAEKYMTYSANTLSDEDRRAVEAAETIQVLLDSSSAPLAEIDW